MRSVRPPGEHELTVDPADLQSGHFVARLDRPWRDTHFPLEGVDIRELARAFT